MRYAKLVAGILHLSTPPIKSSRAMNGLLACGGAGRMISASEINRQVQFYETATEPLGPPGLAMESRVKQVTSGLMSIK